MVSVIASEPASGETDAVNTSIPSTFTLTINSVNDAPEIATIADATIAEDATFELTIPATDVEDQAALTFITGGAAQFTSTVSEGVLTVTPDANWNGSGAVSLIATDPSGANATATFTLTVTPVPDAPVFVAQENTSVNEDEILTLTLAATDADDDPLTYSVGAVSNVVAEVTGTTLTLAPELNFNGPRDVTVTVDDGTNLNDQQTFTLTVNPVNDDPVVALIEPQTMNEDGTLDVTIQASDVDDQTSYARTLPLRRSRIYP